MRSATWSRAGLALWIALAAGCGGEAGPPRPDIVLITLDTLRRDHVGAYAGGALTPNLDAVAARGLVHEAAYTTMPTTGPAHLSLFTGLYPVEHGSLRNGVPLRLSLEERSLPTRLAEAGYRSGAFVTTQLLGPRATGLSAFDEYEAPSDHLRPGMQAARKALAWARATTQPIFLWLHLYDPHSPYGRAEGKARELPIDGSQYGWVDRARFLTPAARRRAASRYADGVRDADDALGVLLSGLRARDPVIAIVADHGESLAEHLETRGYAYDHGEFLDPESVAIPLVLAGPGVASGRSPGTASIRDLYTTLLAAAGIPDDRAEAEGRRDLRSTSNVRRIVGIERRAFRGPVRDLVRTHRAGAAVSQRVVVVGETGALTLDSRPGPDPTVLAEVARQRAGLPPGDSGPVDPATREALRSLGYAE